MTKPTQAQIDAVAKALKECELDCCDWDMDTLREVAGVTLAAATEVVQFTTTLKEQAELDAKTIAATLERCAQVAIDETLGDYEASGIGQRIAAAIRALKDKP